MGNQYLVFITVLIPLLILIPAKSSKKFKSTAYVEVISLQDPMCRSGFKNSYAGTVFTLPEDLLAMSGGS